MGFVMFALYSQRRIVIIKYANQLATWIDELWMQFKCVCCICIDQGTAAIVFNQREKIHLYIYFLEGYKLWAYFIT